MNDSSGAPNGGALTGSAPPPPAWSAGGLALAGILAAATVAAAWHLHGHEAFGRESSIAVLAGFILGLALQRGRYCYFCIIREAIEERDVRALLGLIASLAAGTVGAAVVFDAWIPDATAGHLPPAGNIGPVGWPLALGGLLFGLGMAFSGSCISAHLYRLAEGSLLSPLALAGAVPGFMAGFACWNFVYLYGYHGAPVIWLPAIAGFAPALALQLGILALSAWWLWHYWHRPAGAGEEAGPGGSWAHRLWRERWPAGWTALVVALVTTVMLLRAEPIGVTSALGTQVRAAASVLGLLPERLEGLDSFRGCGTSPRDTWLSVNALFVLALVAGAATASAAGGHFRPQVPPAAHIVSALAGGVLLGFGAMIALGCTVGRLSGGVTALSLCGWIFAATMVAGIATGLRLRRVWWRG